MVPNPKIASSAPFFRAWRTQNDQTLVDEIVTNWERPLGAFDHAGGMVRAPGKGVIMYRLLCAAVASLAVATATSAHAGSPYIGVEAGALVGRDNDVDEFADFATSQTPTTPAGPAGPADREFDDTFNVPYRTGFDVGVLGGYDFGFVRVEAELGHRQAALGNLKPDETSRELLDTLNGELNRPSAEPDPSAPGLPALTSGDFDLSGKMRVRSAMINALLDVGMGDRISIYGGGGYGRSWVKALGDTDSDEAWQYIVGARYKLSDHLELGLKHRYFNSGMVRLRHDGVAYEGNPDRLTVTPPDGPATEVDQTTDVLMRPEIEGKFRSRSYLASLIYNF